MEQLFLVDQDRLYTYSELLSDIQAKQTYSPYVFVKNNEPYAIFLAIVHSLVHGHAIEVLDGDFSEQELSALGIDSVGLFAEFPVQQPLAVTDIADLCMRIKQNQAWSATLLTSGTTGRPKKVIHTLETLTRTAKINERFRQHVWAFAYNPTHMAGLQVFFQALLNQNTIVYAFDGRQKQLAALMNDFSITHLSATATYYRNVMPYLRGSVYPAVRAITFGGEKYDVQLEQQIFELFPNARIRNIYASTEAGSLFTADGDRFEIEKTIAHLIRFSDDNELLLHRSLLGGSDTYALEGDWYSTGDIVERAEDGSFTFVSRQSEFINIGGYKVNPSEVENVLMQVPGVLNLLVKAKANRVTGHILVAEVVKDELFEETALKKAIKQYAAEHLQEWKVPRIIHIVDEIAGSRTGKKVRA
ncbi:fatty acid--CoA ligase family protein [Paenibacillus sp. KS-LC4]|uniref:ANL family adenylate-forming protein n=1 Tax=Paenibacillus sp. KS-LC4 TaxID=2979727 RepID=UPI0030D39D3A